MPERLSLSPLPRERTSRDHSASERSGFMSELLTGQRSKEDHIALAGQHGIGFHLFAQIADPGRFTTTNPTQLDATGWDQQERDRVIDEVVMAYRFNTELFAELSSVRENAVA